MVTGRRIRENLNGTDFTPTILRMADEYGWSLFLLGARPEVVLRSCQRITQQYPGIRIAGFRHGYFAPEEEEAIVRTVNAASPDILLVALGSPLQEKFITKYACRLSARVCLGVGGFFDFLSSHRKRAPNWMRAAGIEWLYRCLSDPRAKWKRIVIEIPMFLSFIAAQRLLPDSVKRTLRGILLP
jgi:exopolysaccharide biosynthesis WecB/TagA/CpsF family protein